MYAIAGRLTPDSYRRLATAVYAEMAAAGISCVGEFHYLHHGPGGTPYDEPNAMGLALVEAAAAAARRNALPLHVHLSEQPAENEATIGHTPTELLAAADALGPDTTAVHAIHLSQRDIDLLGSSKTAICACPTTEPDLADGIGPFPALQQAGSPLCLGSDQHVEIDLVGEARRLEQHERLASGRRGAFAPDDLLRFATEAGHDALGWTDAGRIEPGARADLVAIDLTSVRTAGTDPAQVVMCADVTDVIVDGCPVVRDRQHRLGDIGTCSQRRSRSRPVDLSSESGTPAWLAKSLWVGWGPSSSGCLGKR